MRPWLFLFTTILIGIVISRYYQWKTDYISGIPAGEILMVERPIKQKEFYCVLNSFGWEIRIRISECEELIQNNITIGDELELTQGCVVSNNEGSGKFRNCTAKNVAVMVNKRAAWLSYGRLVKKVAGIKEKVVDGLRKYLPEPESSLIAGIVVGEQSTLPLDLKETLKNTGTMHVVAASGYNVMVVIGLLMPICVRILGRRWGMMITGLGVWIYVLLAGASPPVVRAGMMAGVMMFGLYMGRDYWSKWSLVLVSCVMLIWRPWLIMDVSYQLSIAATIGVVWGNEPILKFLSKYFTKAYDNHIWKQIGSNLAETLSTTLAATFMVAPISVITFGSMSWWGLLVNPMVLWLIPPLMMLGSAMAISVYIWSLSGSIWLWLILPLARLFVVIVQIGGSFSSPMPLTMNWWTAFGWWCGLIGFWSLGKRMSES